MHEFGIIHNIIKMLEEVGKENNLKIINKVTIRIGKLRQVFPDFLQFAFENMSQNTIAQNAELIIKEIPIKMKCNSCKQEFIVECNTYICPTCGEACLEMLSGKEVYIESIEGEEKDAD